MIRAPGRAQIGYLIFILLMLSAFYPATAKVYIHYGKKGVIVLTNDPYYGVDYLKNVELVKTDPAAEYGPRAWIRIPGREVAVEKGLGDEIHGFKIVKIDERSVVVNNGGIRYRFKVKIEEQVDEFEENLDAFLTNIALPENDPPDLSDFMIEETLFVNDTPDSVKIRRKGSDLSIKAEIDDTIDGYRLTEIKKDRLVFEKDGKQHVIPVSLKKVSTMQDLGKKPDFLNFQLRGAVVRNLWLFTGSVAALVLGIAYFIARKYGVTWKRKRKKVKTSAKSRRQLGFQTDDSIIYSGPVRISEMAPNDFVELVTHLIQRSGFMIKKKHEIGIGLAEIVAVSNHPISGGKYLIRCQASSWGDKVDVDSLEILRERMGDEQAVKGIYVSTSPFSADSDQFSMDSNIQLLGLKDILHLAERYYLGEYIT